MKPIIVPVKTLFGPYVGLTLWPFIFIRKDYTNAPWLINHEKIHIKQYEDLWIIGYLPVYLFFFLSNLCVSKNWAGAYLANPFEQEAYRNQLDPEYLAKRRRFAWRNYIT